MLVCVCVCGSSRLELKQAWLGPCPLHLLRLRPLGPGSLGFPLPLGPPFVHKGGELLHALARMQTMRLVAAILWSLPWVFLTCSVSPTGTQDFPFDRHCNRSCCAHHAGEMGQSQGVSPGPLPQEGRAHVSPLLCPHAQCQRTVQRLPASHGLLFPNSSGPVAPPGGPSGHSCCVRTHGPCGPGPGHVHQNLHPCRQTQTTSALSNISPRHRSVWKSSGWKSTCWNSVPMLSMDCATIWTRTSTSCRQELKARAPKGQSLDQAMSKLKLAQKAKAAATEQLQHAQQLLVTAQAALEQATTQEEAAAANLQNLQTRIGEEARPAPPPLTGCCACQCRRHLQCSEKRWPRRSSLRAHPSSTPPRTTGPSSGTRNTTGTCAITASSDLARGPDGIRPCSQGVPSQHVPPRGTPHPFPGILRPRRKHLAALAERIRVVPRRNQPWPRRHRHLLPSTLRPPPSLPPCSSRPPDLRVSSPSFAPAEPPGPPPFQKEAHQSRSLPSVSDTPLQRIVLHRSVLSLFYICSPVLWAFAHT